MKRVLFGIILLLVPLLLLSGCAKKQSPQVTPAERKETTVTESTNTNSGLREFTLEELAKYNGQNGQPAYVAVKGVVYDVTNQKFWQFGKHLPMGAKVIAGQDLTEDLKNAPPSHRTPEMWAEIPKVGKLKKTPEN